MHGECVLEDEESESEQTNTKLSNVSALSPHVPAYLAHLLSTVRFSS